MAIPENVKHKATIWSVLAIMFLYIHPGEMKTYVHANSSILKSHKRQKVEECNIRKLVYVNNKDLLGVKKVSSTETH